MATFFLGVEGGATKSEAILVDEEGEIQATRIGEALNYHNLERGELEGNFTQLLSPLLEEPAGGTLYAVFGLAGLDTPKDKIFYENVIRKFLPNDTVVDIVNDANVALEARCPDCKDRVIVIAGTGSSAYGENGVESAKNVGWDFMLGDEGSGYYFGLRAIRAAVRAWDGRGEKTLLEDFVLENAEVKTMEDFIPKFYDLLGRKASVKRYVASFAPLIDKGIREEDAIAVAIRDEGARELALGVAVIAERLGFEGKPFCVGTMGSQWKMPGLREQFWNAVLKKYPAAELSENEDSGAWGAVLLAQKLKI